MNKKIKILDKNQLNRKINRIAWEIYEKNSTEKKIILVGIANRGLKLANELDELNLFKDNSNIITLVEWPQIVKIKPKHLIELNFEYDDDYKKRYVRIKGLILN